MISWMRDWGVYGMTVEHGACMTPCNDIGVRSGWCGLKTLCAIHENLTTCGMMQQQRVYFELLPFIDNIRIVLVDVPRYTQLCLYSGSVGAFPVLARIPLYRVLDGGPEVC